MHSAARCSRATDQTLAASPALLGSLSLLGNPTILMRSLRADLRCARAARGARHGPKQFVAGLGAGTSSLLKHVSHGALTSVSDFATAVANNISADGSRARALAATGAAAALASIGATALTTDSAAGLAVPPPPPPSRRARLYGAMTRPAAGALQLVSSASRSLIQTVGVYAPPTPAPLPTGLPLPRRASTAWCERALAKNSPGEVYLCHCPAFPALGESPWGGPWGVEGGGPWGVGGDGQTHPHEDVYAGGGPSQRYAR